MNIALNGNNIYSLLCSKISSCLINACLFTLHWMYLLCYVSLHPSLSLYLSFSSVAPISIMSLFAALFHPYFSFLPSYPHSINSLHNNSTFCMLSTACQAIDWKTYLGSNILRKFCSVDFIPMNCRIYI